MSKEIAVNYPSIKKHVSFQVVTRISSSLTGCASIKLFPAVTPGSFSFFRYFHTLLPSIKKFFYIQMVTENSMNFSCWLSIKPGSEHSSSTGKVSITRQMEHTGKCLPHDSMVNNRQFL